MWFAFYLRRLIRQVPILHAPSHALWLRDRPNCVNHEALSFGWGSAMHLIVSDLHMTDTAAASSVSEAELIEFVDRVNLLALAKGEKITLVFAGDILELLRSPKWQALWTQYKSAPWSGMGKGFGNFADGHAEGCAVEIAKAIQERYAGFSRKLKNLVESGKVETTYVCGDDVRIWKPRLHGAAFTEAAPGLGWHSGALARSAEGIQTDLH
jgi:hypothetical protein